MYKRKAKATILKIYQLEEKKVADTLLWLINDNPHYRDVKISQSYLNCLPELGVSHDIISDRRYSY